MPFYFYVYHPGGRTKKGPYKTFGDAVNAKGDFCVRGSDLRESVKPGKIWEEP